MDKLEGEDTIYRSSDSVHKAVNWSDDSIFRRVPKQPKVSWNYKSWAQTEHWSTGDATA
jgi:hypothetical protein